MKGKIFMLSSLDKRVLSIKGDREGIGLFIEENYELIKNATHKAFGGISSFRNKCKYSSYTEEDLYNEAVIVTMQCINRYEPDKGSFTTYLYASMNSLKRILRDKESIIRMPRKFIEASYAYHKALRNGNIEDLPQETIDNAMKYKNFLISSNTKIQDKDGNNKELQDFIEDESSDFENIENRLYAEYILEKSIKKFYNSSRGNKERNIDIVIKHIVEEIPYDELGQIYGFTSQAARNIVSRFRKIAKEIELEPIH